MSSFCLVLVLEEWKTARYMNNRGCDGRSNLGVVFPGKREVVESGALWRLAEWFDSDKAVGN